MSEVYIMSKYGMVPLKDMIRFYTSKEICAMKWYYINERP